MAGILSIAQREEVSGSFPGCVDPSLPVANEHVQRVLPGPGPVRRLDSSTHCPGPKPKRPELPAFVAEDPAVVGVGDDKGLTQHQASHGRRLGGGAHP